MLQLCQCYIFDLAFATIRWLSSSSEVLLFEAHQHTCCNDKCSHAEECMNGAGGQILATDAIRAAYHDGKGSIPMRGKAVIEGDTAGNGNGSDSGSNGNGTTSIKAGKGSKGKTQRKRSGEGKPAVVITELPYQTNKVCRPKDTC